MPHLLIPYVPLADHNDPILDEFTYGDSGRRARKLKRDLELGAYLFLHTTIRGRRYITAYYVVDRVLDTSEAASIKPIRDKYKNPHIKEYLDGDRRNHDDAIVFGDPILSRMLSRPLPFDRTLAEKLSLDISFNDKMSDNQSISSATRAWRKMTNKDVELLLAEIWKYEQKKISPDIILSTDEVLEIREVDLENFIVQNPNVLEPNLTLVGRQRDTRAGRLDLLFEDQNGQYVIVELKLNEIGRAAINQVRRYLRQIRKDTKKSVRGIIVCKDILPTFIKEFEKIRDIRILRYGWKLSIKSSRGSV